MRLLFFRITTVTVCFLLSTAFIFADTIKLKNGSVIKGKVTTFNDREFTVQIDVGSPGKKSSSRMVLAVEDVESIQFDATEAYAAQPVAQNTSPAPVPTATSANSQSAPMPNHPVESANTILAEKNVNVIAAADWTSTEIRLRKGQHITISASGQVDLGNNRRVGPEGITLNDPNKLIADRPTGSLIAVIGDDNDEFIAVGSGTDFIASRDGILFLSVNEGNLRDNTGSFVAKIKVSSK